MPGSHPDDKCFVLFRVYDSAAKRYLNQHELTEKCNINIGSNPKCKGAFNIGHVNGIDGIDFMPLSTEIIERNATQQDKNDKWIFVGDIVKYDKKEYTVIFDENDKAFRFKDSTKKLHRIPNNCNSMEIIGTIHDNNQG